MGIAREDRAGYVREIARLSLWFAGRAAGSAAEFRRVLTARTPVYRLTALWDGERHPAEGERDRRWEDLLDRIPREAPGPGLEERGLCVLWPVLEPAIGRDLRLWPWVPEAYGVRPTGTGEFGLFLYELPAEDPGRIELHMGNALAPSSPFEDMDTRAGELRRLLEDARRRDPSVSCIRTDSWLNHHPLFLRLFPEEWSREKRPSVPGYRFNWWGQFVNRRGGFHAGNAARFRREGTFPYPSVSCECGVTALEAHLHENFVCSDQNW